MNATLPREDRISAKSFLLVCGLLYAVAIALVLSSLKLEHLLRDVNRDDSFYYFQIARNVAHGMGSTYDGFNLTNGYHPLFMVLIIPVYWLFDTFSALWATKVVETSLLFAAFAFFAGSLRHAGLSQWFSLPLLISYTTKYWSGMEVAAHMVVLSLGLWAFTRPRQAAGGNASAYVYVFMALLPWVRLESIAVGYAIIGLLILADACGDRAIFPRKQVWMMALALTCSLFIYLAYNQVIFDSPVPISGRTKQEVFAPVTQRLENILAALAQGYRYVISFFVAAGLCLYISIRKHSDVLFMSGLFLVACAAGSLARLAYTGLTVGVGFGMYGWYFVPAIFSGTASALYALALWHRSRYRKAAVSVLALVCAGAGYAQMERVRGFHAAQDPDWQIKSYEGTVWMNEHLPAGSIIASKDSGVVGYFSTHTVINTDGLVNSYEYLQAQKQGATWAFLKKQNVRYYANLMKKTTGPEWKIDNAVFRRVYSNPVERGDHSNWAFMVYELEREL